MTTKKKIIFDSPTKQIYQGKDLNSLIMHFSDEVYDFQQNQYITLLGKGVINNKINALIMSKLANIGIQTHFIKNLNMKEQAIKISEPINITVRITNVTTDEMASKFNLVQGMVLKNPIVEFFMGNPYIENITNDDQLVYFGIVDPFEMEEIKHIAARTNDFLQGLFSGYNIRLVSVNLKFAKSFEEDFSRIVIADEITPDNTKLLDLTTNEPLDSTACSFGNTSNYLEIAKRMNLVVREKAIKKKVI